MKDIQITDAEHELMRILWSHQEGLTSGALREKLDKNWERTTVLTLLSRLADKGIVSVDREKRPNVFRSLITKDDYSLGKTRSILETLYNGNIKGMMAALCTSGDLTQEDLHDIQKLLDKGAQ